MTKYNDLYNMVKHNNPSTEDIVELPPAGYSDRGRKPLCFDNHGCIEDSSEVERQNNLVRGLRSEGFLRER